MRIHIFGDSFSADIDLSKPDDTQVKYLIHCLQNGIKFYEWPQLLRNEGHTVFNHAISGTDNLTIFEKCLENVDDYQENDLIIIGWTTPERIRIYETFRDCGETNKHYLDDFLTVLPGFDEWNKFKDMLSIETYIPTFNEMFTYRGTQDNVNYEVIRRMKIVNKVLKKHTHLNIIHWFWDPNQFKNQGFQTKWYRILHTVNGFLNLHFGSKSEWKKYEKNGTYPNDMGCSYKSTIYNETDGVYEDCHWSIKGHETFFKIISDQIKKIV